MERIPIGTITKPHGVTGSVRVKTDSDFKDARYRSGNTLYIGHKRSFISVTVRSYFSKGGVDVLTFDEFSTVDEVEKYRGATLFIDDEDREPLEEDAFYYDDLLGMDVFVEDKHVGVVQEVRDMPQAAMIRVEKKDGSSKLVPFLKVYVKAVDSEKRVITLYDTEGLL